jgi:uncharacterized protein involved in exopolysaccharide biosynthesis
MNDDRFAGTVRHRTGLIADIRDYLNVVRRYWWLVGLTTVLSVGLALWLQRSAQPQYSAEVLMQQRVDAPLIGDRGRAGQMDFGGQLELIRSRAVMAEVVQRLQLRFDLVSHPERYSGLIRSVEVQPEAPPDRYVLEARGPEVRLLREVTGEALSNVDASGRVEGPGFVLEVGDIRPLDGPVVFRIRPQQAAVEGLRNRIRVEQARGYSQLRLGYADADAERAALIANTVAETYERHRAEAARADARPPRPGKITRVEGVAQPLQPGQAEGAE